MALHLQISVRRAPVAAHHATLQTMRQLVSRAFLRKAFVQDDDVRPPRTKAFHTHGTVAQMRFVADGDHPFTGLFSSGGVGFVRASLAVGMPAYSPAAALKILHRWSKSVAEPAAAPVPGQAGQPGLLRTGADQSHAWNPATFPNTVVVPLLRFWLSSISHPIELQRLDHLADVTSDGADVERACAPELVYLYGADEVRNDPASTDDFRSILGEIPSETLLYRMYGKASRDCREALHRLGHARVWVRRVGLRGSHPGLPARRCPRRNPDPRSGLHLRPAVARPAIGTIRAMDRPPR